MLFNFIILSAGINLFAFMATTLLTHKKKDELLHSGLKDSNKEACDQAIDQLIIYAGLGFGAAILAILSCIFFVLKRAKVMKQIQIAELEAFQDLEIK